jgi:hypothetical protein
MTTKNTKLIITTPKIIQIIPCDIYPEPGWRNRGILPCLTLRDDGDVIAMVFDFSIKKLIPYPNPNP